MAENLYKAEIHWGGEEFFIGTPPSGHSVIIDTKGENKSAPTPLEMLLMSVAACTATDIVSILTKKRQKITGYKAIITGMRRDEHPRFFKAFHIHHLVYGHDVSEQAVARAIELSDTKYCSVAATVRPTATITTSFEIIEAE
jgi:putative redox protein